MVPVDPQSEGGPSQKRAKHSPLHTDYAVPITFFEDAVNKPEEFLGSREVGKSFGLNGEAYLRQSHEEFLEEIAEEVGIWYDGGRRKKRMVEVRGSSGIGKSAFLAYTIAYLRHNANLKSFAIFYSMKSPHDGQGSNLLDDVLCSVWIDGELKINKKLYRDVKMRQKIMKEMENLVAIFLDGCSITLQLHDFTGFIIAAASPSVTTDGLRGLMKFVELFMPPWTLEESLKAGLMLGEREDVIKDNFNYMPGIARYSFEAGAAKDAVSIAVKKVHPKIISNLVASQLTDKDTEKSMVHALVLWVVEKGQDGRYRYREDVRYELVSRYAERLVARKLSSHESTELNNARRSLHPLSGAGSYAGALFEAFAIREFLAGGSFVLQSLEGNTSLTSLTIEVPKLGVPEVFETNTLSTATVPLNTVHTADENGAWVPKMLWPTTTNFPTFDAYYFHKDGDVYALQMTTALTHPLKNNGAYQTKEYLSKIGTATEPYKAVFVVPKRKNGYEKQAFTGNVTQGTTISMTEEQAKPIMDQCFKQWVIELES